MKTPVLATNSDQLRALLNEVNGDRAVTIVRILTPTDFSAVSEKALKYAERLAEEFQVILEPDSLDSLRTGTSLGTLEKNTESSFPAFDQFSENRRTNSETKQRRFCFNGTTDRVFCS
jgi:hypothetical protein